MKIDPRILKQIEGLEADAHRMKINANIFIEKIATLKEELSGGSDSSNLKSALSESQIAELRRRRRKSQIKN